MDQRDADAGMMAEVDRGSVEGQVSKLCPEVELVPLGSATEAAEEPFGKLN
jgi:hypothetical protein